MLASYNEEDYNNLFHNNSKDFVDVIENISQNTSTQKSYYSALIFLLREFNCDTVEFYADKIKNLKLKDSIEQNEKMKNEVLPISVANEMMDKLNVDYKDDGYTHDNQMYVMSYIIKNYGVLRPDEWRSIYISDCDCEEPNYINVETKKLYIKQHKTMKNVGTREYDLDEHICSILKHGVNNYMITTTSNGKQYSRSDKLDAMFKRKFEYKIYDYRKAVVSLAFNSKDVKKIKQIY
jgi:hypothetical protein